MLVSREVKIKGGGADLSVVARQLKEELPAVHVPILDEPILSHSKDIMRIWHECYLQRAALLGTIHTTVIKICKNVISE